jgi:DNA-binding NtrC family response regulator
VPGSGNTTVPSPDDEAPLRPSGPRFVPALVLCWAPIEPDRVGEVALVDAERSSEWILGRDLLPEDDPAAPVRFVQQRPGANRHSGALGGINISRRQLHIRVTDAGLDVTNIGAAVLSINGHEAAKNIPHSIAPGAVFALRAHSTYRLTTRPVLLPSVGQSIERHPFGHPDADGIVGESPAAWTLRAEIAAAGRTHKHVLILGPTGTGKELAAHAIHRLSERRGPFVAFNAANVTPSLAESILFGNAANYPNPGTPERLGLFGEAQGGALFLDELGELPIEVQARLLRALEGQYTRLGESRPRNHAVIVVAATNRDPSAIKDDIFHRFGAIVRVPALADRKEDIPLLVRALIVAERGRNPALAGRFVHPAEPGEYPHVVVSSRLVVAMLGATYDGNVRAVSRLLDRAMTDTQTVELNPPADMAEWHMSRTIPPRVNGAPEPSPTPEPQPDALALTESVIRRTLVECGWNVTLAARTHGLSRDALVRRMEKLGIRRPSLPP